MEPSTKIFLLHGSTPYNRGPLSPVNPFASLNEEMKGIDGLAAHLKTLRRNVDALDSSVSRVLRIT